MGYRSPNKDQLIKIAQVLDCDVSALIDHTPISNFEFLQILFDYEEDLKIRPLVEDSTIGLLSHDMILNDFLTEWYEIRKNTIMEKLQMKNLRIGSSHILRSLDLKNNYDTINIHTKTP